MLGCLKALSGALFCFLCSGANLIADEALAGLPVNVAGVATSGYWAQDASEGFIRAVVLGGGVEHSGTETRVYMQRISVDAESNEYSVHDTATLPLPGSRARSVITVAAVPTKQKSLAGRFQIICISESGKYKEFLVICDKEGTCAIRQ